MYRPDGWQEKRAVMEIGLKAGGIPVRALEDWRNTYEVGADAMLEGLKNGAIIKFQNKYGTRYGYTLIKVCLEPEPEIIIG